MNRKLLFSVIDYFTGSPVSFFLSSLLALNASFVPLIVLAAGYEQWTILIQDGSSLSSDCHF